VMTHGRYEIEFQGSNDAENWTAYQFRYKPQDMSLEPRIYAPYQPRFEWNLWFASLDTWRDQMFVVSTEERLLANSRDVLALFHSNPFGGTPPKYVRAVIWEYWFTSMAEKRATGMWWRRKFLGLYAPSLTYLPDGRLGVVEYPPPPMPRP
jgi:lipase maturation factor